MNILSASEPLQELGRTGRVLHIGFGADHTQHTKGAAGQPAALRYLHHCPSPDLMSSASATKQPLFTNSPQILLPVCHLQCPCPSWQQGPTGAVGAVSCHVPGDGASLHCAAPLSQCCSWTAVTPVMRCIFYSPHKISSPQPAWRGSGLGR